MAGMDDSRFHDDQEVLRARFRMWGLRFYAGAFVALGFLALAHAVRHTETLRLIAKVMAGTAGALAIAMGVLSYSYGVRYRRRRR